MARRRRQRGEGTVYFDRTARSWVALVSLGIREDGRRIRRKVRAPSEPEARAELERMQRSYRSGGAPARETLDTYLRDWLRHHATTIAPTTAVSYGGHIEKHISPLLGGRLVGRLQPDDVKRLIADRTRAGLSPATVGRIVTTLRIALNQALRDRAIPDNPAAGVRLPRVRREPIRALSAPDTTAIRSAIRDNPFETIYVLLMGTGMRAGEACGLDWRDVDLDAGTAFIRQGKTRRSIRTVYLSPPIVDALRAHQSTTERTAPHDPVFTGPRSRKRLATPTLSHHFPRLLERAGLPPMRVHDLRHGFATRALAQGASIRTIADILGHATPSITANTYAHVVPEAHREATDLVGSELR